MFEFYEINDKVEVKNNETNEWNTGTVTHEDVYTVTVELDSGDTIKVDTVKDAKKIRKQGRYSEGGINIGTELSTNGHKNGETFLETPLLSNHDNEGQGLNMKTIINIDNNNNYGSNNNSNTVISLKHSVDADFEPEYETEIIINNRDINLNGIVWYTGEDYMSLGLFVREIKDNYKTPSAIRNNNMSILSMSTYILKYCG